MESQLGDVLGANPLSTGECSFLVWVPRAKSVKLQILSSSRRSIPMQPLPKGYFRASVEDAVSCRYLYDLGGAGDKMRADPASRFQPEGVHGPSRALLLRRAGNGEEMFAVFNSGRSVAPLSISLPGISWTQVLNSRDLRWAGPGSALPHTLTSGSALSLTLEPLSFALYYSVLRGKP